MSQSIGLDDQAHHDPFLFRHSIKTTWVNHHAHSLQQFLCPYLHPRQANHCAPSSIRLQTLNSLTLKKRVILANSTENLSLDRRTALQPVRQGELNRSVHG